MSGIQEAKDLTDDVAESRLQALKAKYPQLEASKFSSEEEYRKALLDQYRNMRGEEYNLVCRDVGIKNYDLSVTLCQKAGNNKYMNTQAWNGCSNASKRFPEMQEAIADSAYVRIPTHITPSLSGGNAACCAVSSKAIESKISAEMGFDDKQNFVQYYGTLTNGAYYHRAADGMMTDPATKDCRAKGNLWNLVESGKVGPGSSIAIKSAGTQSGYHAKTVIAVDYDKNGKLKSITLQGNNNNTLETLGPTTRNSKYNQVLACDMSGWMNKQLDQQKQNMQSMSTADLEATVAAQKAKMETRISDLHTTEQHLFANHNNSCVQNYATYYTNNANTSNATTYVLRADRDDSYASKPFSEQITQGLTIDPYTFDSSVPIFEQQLQQNNKSTQSKTAPVSKQPQKQSVQTAPQQTETAKQQSQATTANVSRMRSMLENMNKKTPASKQIDVDQVINSMVNTFGDNADKVLTKALMAPTNFIKSMNLNAKSSREVILQLCQMDKGDDRSTQKQSVQTAPKQTETAKQQSQATTANVSRMRSMLERMNKKTPASKQIDVDQVVNSMVNTFGDNADKVLTKALMAPTNFIQNMNLNAKSSREVILQLCQMDKGDDRSTQAMNIALAQHSNQGR